MNVRTLAASGVLVGAFGLALATSAPALAACDAYSGNCPSVTPTKSPAGEGAAKKSTTKPSTLPFTGGEVVLLSAIGAGALVGGTALVIAGRRRSATDS